MAPSASPSGPFAADTESDAESSTQVRKRQRRIPLACNVSGNAEPATEASESESRDEISMKIFCCRLCKSRKQRCNMDGRGANDPCKSCEKAGTDCIIQEKAPKTEYPIEYVTFLESRIASLEGRLAEIHPGDDLINDHLDGSKSRPLGDRRTTETVEGDDHNRSEEHKPESGEVKNEIAAGVALLSLNSASEPHYLGGSSGYSWAKVLLGTLHRPASSLFRPNETFKTRYRESNGTLALVRPDLPSRQVADAMVNSFYMHVQARYAFVDWRKLRDWVARQEEVVQPKGAYSVNTPEGREKGAASFFVWMTYAIGARLLQGVPLPGIAEPEAYYAAALEHMDVIVTLHNIENVQAFLYLAMYSLRCAEGPSVWHLTGIAMKMCVELGMHRRRKLPKGVTPYQEEIRKRTWWTVYGLDRWFALTLGRPLGIDDRDIDQALPLDIECDIDPPQLHRQTSHSHSLHLQTAAAPCTSPMSVDHDVPPNRPLTSMSSAIHGVRLRRIEAQIQKTAYRLDADVEETRAEISAILDKLDRWKESRPIRPQGQQYQGVPCCSDDWFLMKTEAAKLFLLRPITAKAQRGDPLLAACAQSCVQQCEVFRRMHQNYPLANSLSLTDLHNIFLTGLTLLHLLLTHPRVIPMRESSRAIRACSTALFVYAQHFKAAEPFRDAFEDMANACLDACERAAEDDSAQVEQQQRRGEGENAWEKHVGEMAAWMMNANAQKEFLQLVTSLGFNPNVPLDLAQPTPLQQELVFAPQVPFQAPLFSGESHLYAPAHTSSSSGTNYISTGQGATDFALFPTANGQAIALPQSMQPHQAVQALHPSLLTLGNHTVPTTLQQHQQRFAAFRQNAQGLGGQGGGSGMVAAGGGDNMLLGQNRTTTSDGMMGGANAGAGASISGSSKYGTGAVNMSSASLQGQVGADDGQLHIQGSTGESASAASTPFGDAFIGNEDWFKQFANP